MDENMRRIFAENLRRFMAAEGKNQKDLSQYMHVSTATSADWYNGKKMPRTDKIQSIANWLGVEMAVLLGEKEQTYYFNEETAELAQKMLEDPDMRSLFHMKRNMDPQRFKTHIEYMKTLYKQEHPEDDDVGC